ncbi:MAG: hypothetical protein AAGC60_00695 [Acidobacteriota bacterium]
MSDSTEAKKSAQEIESYWTPERRAKAKGMSNRPAIEHTEDAREPDGPQKTSPGFDPEASDSKARHRDRASSALVFTPATRVADPTAYPWRTVGKLYFTAGGEDFTGSASVIYTNTLITAAHNLWSGGVWSSDILFVPAFTDGVEPFGSWTWQRASVMPGWQRNENEAYDVGTIEMRTGGHDRRSIGAVVGYLGYTVNRTLPREWTDVGYPRNYQDKRFMYKQPGMYTRSLDRGSIVGKEGDMAGGASGGPWLMPPGDLDLVNGIHSFRNESRYPNEVFSPYFNTAIGDFIAAHRR